MSEMQVSFNATTGVATVAANGTAVPAGSTAIGTFHHPETDPLGYAGGHVLYHHVQELLYHKGHLNMQVVNIQVTAPVAVTGVSLAPATAALVVDDTEQLTPTVTPANASDKTVSYSSSDEEMATVDTDGLVTAVGVGEATITCTTTDGDKTDTCVVTVSAE